MPVLSTYNIQRIAYFVGDRLNRTQVGARGGKARACGQGQRVRLRAGDTTGLHAHAQRVRSVSYRNRMILHRTCKISNRTKH
eukprot:6179602-Pleurochrysis_carterae.AAC.4